MPDLSPKEASAHLETVLTAYGYAIRRGGDVTLYVFFPNFQSHELTDMTMIRIRNTGLIETSNNSSSDLRAHVIEAFLGHKIVPQEGPALAAQFVDQASRVPSKPEP